MDEGVREPADGEVDEEGEEEGVLGRKTSSNTNALQFHYF